MSALSSDIHPDHRSAAQVEADLLAAACIDLRALVAYQAVRAQPHCGNCDNTGIDPRGGVCGYLCAASDHIYQMGGEVLFFDEDTDGDAGVEEVL